MGDFPKMKNTKEEPLIIKEEPISNNPYDWSVQHTLVEITRLDPRITVEDLWGFREEKIDGHALMNLNMEYLNMMIEINKVTMGVAMRIMAIVRGLMSRTV